MVGGPSLAQLGWDAGKCTVVKYRNYMFTDARQKRERADDVKSSRREGRVNPPARRYARTLNTQLELELELEVQGRKRIYML